MDAGQQLIARVKELHSRFDFIFSNLRPNNVFWLSFYQNNDCYSRNAVDVFLLKDIKKNMLLKNIKSYNF